MTAIEALLTLDHDESLATTALIEQTNAWRDVRRAAAALDHARPGDLVAYAIALDGPLRVRALTLVLLRWQLRRLARAFESAGGRSVAIFAVEPSLDRAAFLIELRTPASAYADRCLRPRGRAAWLRKLVSQLCGCDPALGGIVVVACKR